MKLWLLCFVLLFAAAEGLQTLGGWPGLGPGGLWSPLTVWSPLTLLAGVGLAVLSNAKALGLGTDRSPSPANPAIVPSPQKVSPPAPTALNTQASRPVAVSSPEFQVPSMGAFPQATTSNVTAAKANASPRTSSANAAKANSISFDIQKPTPGRQARRQSSQS